jgi:transcriptional regulator with XRE-family HTH domain
MDANSIETSAMRTAVANQMRIQRTIKRWSQDDLAKNSGLGRSTIQRLEKGLVAMDIKHMQSISTAFGIHWLDFMKLVNDELEATQ